jgi:hypothetical protein
MARVEPNVPIVLLQSFDDAVAVGLLPQRLTAWIAGSVGSIGVGLAALGLYGLMAFLVTQRTREIAIRMALGASDGTMRSMVMTQAAWLGTTGVVNGTRSAEPPRFAAIRSRAWFTRMRRIITAARPTNCARLLQSTRR